MIKKAVFTVAVLSILGLMSCDKVNPPKYGCMDPLATNFNPDNTIADGPCQGNCEYDTNAVLGCMDENALNYNPMATSDNCDCIYEGQRNVLVEDYTGFRCSNCPVAAETLHDLEVTYGSRIIPIALHVGSLSEPDDPPFTTDFRTEIGAAYADEFGTGLFQPNGMINRKKEGGVFAQLYDDWEDMVIEALEDTAAASILIDVEYDSISRNATATIDVDVFIDLIDAPYRIVVLLTEDSVLDWQLDNRFPDEPEIEDYVHMHVLRAGFTDTWGDALNSGDGMAAGFGQNLTFDLVIGNDFNEHHCNVVAFIFRDDTKEVIQSQYVHVLE